MGGTARSVRTRARSARLALTRRSARTAARSRARTAGPGEGRESAQVRVTGGSVGFDGGEVRDMIVQEVRIIRRPLNELALRTGSCSALG